MPETLPTIRIGRNEVSRLVLGSNPCLGYSYQGAMLGRLMSQYFTDDNIHRLLLRSLELGINTWQSPMDERISRALTRLRAEGRDIQWVFLADESNAEDPALLRDIIAKYRPIAVCHHGGVTDRLWREGKIQQVRDFTQRVKDMGVPAGISAHNPDVIAFAEEQGWNLDLYMACFYRLTRTPEELQQTLGEVPLWGNFLPGDPERMCAVIRQVQRPCLAFKILAGGRQAEYPEATAQAFEFAFRSIKATDAVIVGMFPCLADEPGECAALARKLGGV